MRPAPLDRKLLRDLWRMRWQVAAIALLIACGVAVAVMAFSAQRALAEAQRTFYDETRFADVFAQAKRVPISRARDLAAIDGVIAVDARIVQSGLMDVPGLERPATARLISLPEDLDRSLNRVRLVRGRMPDPSRTGEAVALKTFMDAAGVQLGEPLKATINGRAITLTIVGAVLSPEYVYVPSPESFMPDDAHQGVFWATRQTVERAGGLHGAFNSASLRVASGASLPAVLQDVDRLLGAYGGRAAYARADQPSHAFLDAELKELSTSAAILPPVFLVVAASLVHLVVSRLVDAEREQIGLLKAFGYRDRDVARVYLRMAAAIGLGGAVMGGAAGGALGAAIVDLYRAYFRFPVLSVHFHWTAYMIASAVSVTAAAAGSLAAVRRVVTLAPTVAMQPPQPTVYAVGVLDRMTALDAFDQASRMIVRSLERFPGRALLTASGLAASLTLLIGTQFLFDGVDQVVDATYYRAQRWSDAITFVEPRDVAAVRDAARRPGVYAADPTRVVAARFKAGGRQETVRIVGLEPGSQLHRPLDAEGRRVPFEGRGLVLSEALATRLGVAPGDVVWTEVLEGRRPGVLLPVTGLARDYSGLSAYMSRAALNRVMGEGDLASGADLLLAGDVRPAFYRVIERTPQIIGASSRDDTVASWRLVMAQSFRTAIIFYLGFAGAIAFGVAYNTCRIALSERGRDLATLQVLGFGPVTCAYVLVGELIILSLLAIPLGALGGQALAHGLVAAYSREELRLPAVIGVDSYAMAIAIYLVIVVVACGLVARRVWTFDLVAVLKTRE